jgi:CubicO group peptidase (beta-lactamase class C family)
MCQYLEEKIWEPIGAEFEAAWITDSHGKEIGFSHFQVTQRDLVKVGVMLVNKGVFNGKRIISESYLDEATNLAKQPANFQVGKVNLLAGYGYQFWLMKQEGRFAMWGVRGQFMYIDQKSKTVMLINSVWQKRINQVAAVHTQRLFNAVVDAGSDATP